MWEAIPNEFLSPENAPPVTVVQAAFSADDHSLGYYEVDLREVYDAVRWMQDRRMKWKLRD